MATQFTNLEELRRMGSPVVTDRAGMSSYGRYYISLGLSSNYIHLDGTVWDLTCNDEGVYNGWFNTEEETQRAISAFNEKMGLFEIKVLNDKEYKKVAIDDAQRYYENNIDAYYNCTVEIKVFRDDMFCTDVVGLSPRGWGREYSFYVPIGADIEAIQGQKRINGELCKLITVDQAEAYWDTVKLLNNGDFNRTLYCLHDGYTSRVTGLPPKQWDGDVVNFYVPVDADVNNVKEIKKLWLHADVVNALDTSGMKLTYYGNNAYYATDVKNTFNSSMEHPIKMDDKGDIYCRGNLLRLGRVLAQLKPESDSTDIEAMVTRHKAKYTVDTSKVKVTDDIGGVYSIDSCGGSCMAHKPHKWFDIYRDAGSKIAYIENNGELLARALLHTVIGNETGKEYVVLDRIFFDREIYKITLKQWANEQGYTRMSRIEETVRTKGSIECEYEGVPYIDTLCYATYYNGNLHLTNDGDSSYEDYLQNTDGGSDRGWISHGEDSVYCEDSNRHIHVDDAFYCETDECYYEYEDGLVYVSGHGYYSDDDDTVAYDEYASEYNFVDDLNYCESRSFYTSSDDYYYIEKGDYRGSYEYIDDIVYADDVGGYVMYDDATYIEDLDIHVYDREDYFEHSDGQWYSYEEEKEEEIA